MQINKDCICEACGQQFSTISNKNKHRKKCVQIKKYLEYENIKQELEKLKEIIKNKDKIIAVQAKH